MAKPQPKPAVMSEMEARLADRYGITMTVAEVAEVLGMTVPSIYTLRSTAHFDITMFHAARRRLIAYTHDVAEYLDKRRDQQIRAEGQILDQLRR